MIHHLMVGTWTPPGAIFTFAFDDVSMSLEMVKRTAIPEDEPISWMTFDVSVSTSFYPRILRLLISVLARKEEYIWSFHEEVV